MNSSAILVLLAVGLLDVVSAAPVEAGVEGKSQELLTSDDVLKKLKADFERKLLVEGKSQESLSTEDAFENEGRGLRFRRVTCDLLSFSIGSMSLNHAACAAHCLAMGKGFRGGRCLNGVCHCRK